MLLSKDQMRSFEKLHDGLARKMHEHYTDHCGVVADVDIAFVDQTTFGEIITSLGKLTTTYTFTMSPLGPVAISYAPSVSYAFIESTTGSKPDGLPTKSEREVLHEVFKKDLALIEEMWAPITKVKGEHAEFETDPESLTGVLEKPTSTALIAFEIALPNASGLIEISYPMHETLETIIPKLEVPE